MVFNIIRLKINKSRYNCDMHIESKLLLISGYKHIIIESIDSNVTDYALKNILFSYILL